MIRRFRDSPGFFLAHLSYAAFFVLLTYSSSAEVFASINIDAPNNVLAEQAIRLNEAPPVYVTMLKEDLNTIYSDVFERYGAVFVFEYLSINPRIVASAKRYKDNWIIEISMGLATHPKMTPDVLALIACHEIAHHIGGAPKKELLYAGSEAQSDYWAAQKCYKDYLAFTEHRINTHRGTNYGSSTGGNDTLLSSDEVELINHECSISFETSPKHASCVRTAQTSKRLINFLASLRKKATIVSFTSPSKARVWRTNVDYPSYQCRLDTLFNGAICNIPTDDFIDQRDELVSGCMEQNRHMRGRRPACWYKPFSVFPH
jgi:hypothetical protein